MLAISKGCHRFSGRGLYYMVVFRSQDIVLRRAPVGLRATGLNGDDSVSMGLKFLAKAGSPGPDAGDAATEPS
jgi:hypothetical protein